MKSLRRLMSWILILTLCCGEFTPQMAVYAADVETVISEGDDVSADEIVISEDKAVSGDEAEAPEDETVSEDAAVSEDEVNVSEDKAVSEDEVTAPEEKEEESEGDGYYEDALVSDDVPVEEEEDVDADSFCALSFKMYYDQKESRKLGRPMMPSPSTRKRTSDACSGISAGKQS